MLTQRRLLLTALSAMAVLGSAYSARATSIEFLATPFGRDEPSVRILMEEDAGDIIVSLFANEGITDLKAVFLDVLDQSRLKGLTVIGDDVSAFSVRLGEPRKHDWDHDSDRKWDRKWDDKEGDKKRGDRDHRGGKHHGKHHGNDDFGFGKHPDLKFSPNIAVALGTSCLEDPLLETTFVLDAKGDLALSDFIGEPIALLVKGVRDGECDKNDKKCDDDPVVLTLVTTVPVPEPASALLVALGVGSLGYAARSRRSR